MNHFVKYLVQMLFRSTVIVCSHRHTNTLPTDCLTRPLSGPGTKVGPTGAGPTKNRQGPGKNNWTDHVPSGLPDKNFGILGHFWY